MPKKVRKKSDRIAAIEISHSELGLVVIQDGSEGEPKTVHTRSLIWRRDAPSLHTEAGVKELTLALKTLAIEERLGGLSVKVALNGDFCVTRVVSGSAEKVRNELRSLEERTNLYLSLGVGDKSLAAHDQQVDARNHHAWLAVTNKKTLESLIAATEAAGLTVDLMEPSLVSMCRAVGNMEGDAESPALIVAVNERGVELGISRCGRLLLDYRPGGRQARAEIASTVRHHLERLQRYCDHHFGYEGGNISRLYLCGDRDAVAGVHQELVAFDRLKVEVLDTQNICPEWTVEGDAEETELMAAIGAALAAGRPVSERNGPNLLDRTRAGQGQPLIRGLLTAAWPVAAAILIAIGVLGAGIYEQGQCDALQARLDSMEPDLRRYRMLQGKFTAMGKKLKHMRNLKTGLQQRPSDGLMTTVAQCLPDDVWLERLTVSGKGTVTIIGSSYTEDGVFEFVRHLREAPPFVQVALEGTEPANVRAGPATQFDITCRLADFADQDGGAENNG